MKIVMVGELPPVNVGGFGVHITNLSQNLAKYAEVTVITSGKKNEVINKNNIKIYSRKIPFEKRYTTFQRDFVKISFLNKLKTQYDLIHYHGLFSPFGFLLNDRVPLVITVHGYASFETASSGRIKPNSIQFKFARKVERKTVKRADAVIAVGKTLRKWLIEELGAEPEKVFYVPNGIDPEVFKPINFNEKEKREIKRKYGMPEDSIILLFTKHFTLRYGIEYILKSLKFLLKNQERIYLVATNDDNYLPKIKNLARDLNVYNRCIFTGRLPLQELVKLYNVADVFLHTSINEQETFGISLIEAMACELPVIATAVGGPKEILKEGKKHMGKNVGILIPPKDPEAIAQAITYLLEHPEEAREMGKRAREFVLKNYTWDMVAKKTIDVYRYAIAENT